MALVDVIHEGVNLSGWLYLYFGPTTFSIYVKGDINDWGMKTPFDYSLVGKRAASYIPDGGMDATNGSLITGG